MALNTESGSGRWPLFLLAPLLLLLTCLAVASWFWIESKTRSKASQFDPFKSFGNERGSIGIMRVIYTAQALYHKGYRDRIGKLEYGSLDQLGAADLITQAAACGVSHDYRFTCQPGSDPSKTWYATAAPVVPGQSAERFFFINHQRDFRFDSKPIQFDPATCIATSGQAFKR